MIAANAARLIFDFNLPQTPEDVMDAIDHIRYKGGNRNTTGALKVTRDSVFTADGGRRPEYPGLIILITDGVPTRDVAQLVETSDSIKIMEVTIIAIGVTSLVSHSSPLKFFFQSSITSFLNQT